MFDLASFVEECRAAACESDAPGAVRNVIDRALTDKRSISEVLGDGPPHTTLHRSSSLTVQAIIWPTGILIPPHDHRMWAVVGVVHGQEDNALYTRAGAKLRLVRRVSVEEAEVLVLDEDAVHAVANPCSRPTLGLHVYGGDILGASRSTWDSAGCEERPFDPELYERFATGFEQLRRRLGREPEAEEVRAFTSAVTSGRPGR